MKETYTHTPDMQKLSSTLRSLLLQDKTKTTTDVKLGSSQPEQLTLFKKLKVASAPEKGRFLEVKTKLMFSPKWHVHAQLGAHAR